MDNLLIEHIKTTLRIDMKNMYITDLDIFLKWFSEYYNYEIGLVTHLCYEILKEDFINSKMI